ncbi:MAG: NADH-quinone oxidoreductase subunit J [Verrucomicrobiaceae bacterium]|nr:MAG: NADH-quinone oxidoreductase subunit J [Verrucomicrobiaceae bacterium]
MVTDFLKTCCADPMKLIGEWFVILPALVLLLAAAAAVVMRNLIHAALLLTLSFIALGIVFIALGAEFVGFVQLLVYVGAVAMVIVFSILLTKPDQLTKSRNLLSGFAPAAGVAVAFTALAALLGFIFSSPLAKKPMPAPASAPVAAIGEALMGDYVIALIVLGILLTAALVGAAVIAMEDKP